MNRILFLISILVLVLQAAPAQPVEDEAVLATVGNDVITVEEYRARYALTVFPYKDQERLTPIVRRQFLYALIAERLLAQEARRQGFDAEDRFRRNRRMAEEMFVRDRLYRDSIRSVVTVSDAEVRAFFEKEQRRIEYDFLFSAAEEEMRNLYRILRGGVPFDTLLVLQQRADPTLASGAEGTTSSARELIPLVDTLGPGAWSKPIEASDGWYIVRKLDYGNPIRSEYELQKSFKRLENELRTRREAERTAAFVRRLWNDREATLAQEPYAELGDVLFEHYRMQAAADTSNMLLAQTEVFDSLRRAWAQKLDAPFATVASTLRDASSADPSAPEVLRIGEALDRLQALDLRLKRHELHRFPELYRGRVHDMLDRFIITRKGYALGLHQDTHVQREVAMWAANGLAQMMPDLLWEQYIASDDSLWQLYIRRPDLFGPPVEVKIVEVLLDSREKMEGLQRRFDDGASMHALAMEYSERPGAEERRGELGWFPVTAYGMIGRTAFGMRIADVAGPLRTPEGWSFFQLMDRRYPGMRLPSMDALRDSIVANERAPLTRVRIDQLLRRIAGRERVTVHTELLDRVPLRSMQMFTIRYLGFGGRIPAMPSLMPLHEAVIEGLMQSRQEVP